MKNPLRKGDRPEPPGSGPRSGRGTLAALLLGTALLFGVGLGRTDLWAPDEPRYGAISEELRSFRHGLGGLVLLHLNDRPYTQKPPLYFWLAAGLGAPFGRVHEAIARLPSAVAGFASVLLTVWIGELLFRCRRPAILAAGMLATSFRFAFSARRVQLDVLLTAFELGAIGLFLHLDARPGGLEQARRFPAAIAGLHACLGAAALVKGPVGWLPLLVFAVFLAWEGRLGAFRAIAPAWAWLLSVGPVALWITSAISLAPSGFANMAVLDNLFGRFFSGTAHVRPFYYYVFQLPLDFLPWSLFLPLGLWVLWRRTRSEASTAGTTQPSRTAARFLFTWIFVPFVFFSLSAGKRGLYLLPIFPALAMTTILAGPVSGTAAAMGAAFRRPGLTILAVGMLELALFVFVLPRFHIEKSPRPIALAAASLSREGRPLGVYRLRSLEGAMTYYGVPSLISLTDESQLRAHLLENGGPVLIRDRDFRTLGSRFDLHARQTFRSARRRLVLAEAPP